MALQDLPKDEASMRLAHPFRTASFCSSTAEVLRRSVGEREWAQFLEVLRDESILAGDIVTAIQDRRLRQMENLVRMSANSAGSTEMGGAMPFLVMLRHLEMPYPIFRVEDGLIDILTKTDISDDLTVSMLPLPYRRLYVELGQSRTLSETISNIDSGIHGLEGAYIEQGSHERFGEGYYIMLTGSPLGKDDAMDDATLAIFLPTNVGEARLEDVLNDSVKSANEQARRTGLRETPEAWTRQCYECLLLLIKALLYISLPDARRELHPERTQALKDMQGLKSPGKRAKAERRMRKLSDYIVVKAAVAHERTIGHGEHEGGVKPHWRRAHYRMQAHGPRMSLRKLVFITEMLVGAGDSEGDGKAKVSDYVVR
jgi:hypothetical protein